MKNFLQLLPYTIMALIFLVPSNAHTQKRATGLTFDDEAYDDAPLQPRYGGSKYNEIPLEYSLRKYCPTPRDQGNMSSCVGWSSGYGLLTMSKAIQNKVTNTEKINQFANSALFIYNQIILNPNDCTSGASLTDAVNLLKDQGDCLEETFDSSDGNCDVLPSSESKGEANFYKIKDYAALFAPSDPAELKIDKIRKSLVNDKPVLVGMQLTTSFFLVSEEEDTWAAGADEGADEAFGHAMVVVAYDEVERYFEVMNSFGENWGDQGFVKIGYDEFTERCRYAFQIIFNNYGAAAKPVIDTQSLTSLSGNFEFRQITKAKKDEYGNYVRDYLQNKIYDYNVAAVNKIQGQHVYEMTEDWKAGTRFQLAATQVPEGKHVYVFSINSENKVKSHFPKEDKAGKIPPMATYLPSQDAELIIPSPTRGLLLEKGEDNLVVLFSDETIDDYKIRLDKINNNSLPIQEKIQAGFKDLLLPEKEIVFKKDKMQFKTKQAKSEKQVVAIILKSEGL